MKAQLENSQEKVTTGAQGVTSGQKGSKRANRAKRAFLDHIIDQKRLIKGFRLKISKITITKIKAQRTYSQEKVPTEVDRATSGQKGSKIDKKGKKRPFWTIGLIKNG